MTKSFNTRIRSTEPSGVRGRPCSERVGSYTLGGEASESEKMLHLQG